MSPDKISSLLRGNGIPQVALSKMANINMGTLSLWLRGYAQLSEHMRDEIDLTVRAMISVSDETQYPLDWRQCPKLRPIVDEKVAEYRRARSTELRRKYEAST